MKTAHAGNIANNAYLVAKCLRREGEDAHAFTSGTSSSSTAFAKRRWLVDG